MVCFHLSWKIYTIKLYEEYRQNIFPFPVLPAFHVSLKVYQSYIKPNETIQAVVEAKYSYGKPVRGSCSVSAFVFLPNSGRKIRFKNQIKVLISVIVLTILGTP